MITEQQIGEYLAKFKDIDDKIDQKEFEIKLLKEKRKQIEEELIKLL